MNNLNFKTEYLEETAKWRKLKKMVLRQGWVWKGKFTSSISPHPSQPTLVFPL
jgi:hypothetical protein